MIIYKGRVDSDADALEKRAAINSKCKHNLEDWIFTMLKQPKTILDLGCGNGKQMQFLQMKFPDSEITGIDISKEATQNAAEFGTVICGSFDDDLVEGRPFDLILSVYSMYYSKNMIDTIEAYKNKLAPKGMLLVVGPGAGTNRELVDLSKNLTHIPDFISKEELDTLGATVERLENSVEFKDHTEFMSWWSNHNMYDESIVDDVLNSLPDRVTLTKNVLAVKLRND